MTTVTLRPLREGSQEELDGPLLAAWLRAVAAGSGGMEHVSIQCEPGRTELVFFHAVESSAEAADAGRALGRRALDEARRIGAWTVATPLPEQSDRWLG
ncbi:hypothetical protein BX285_1448 [Streptomyces sp. 1114.5]|uniref:hypothetical protein n=1 Tax=unclassified Streptomyces TaxID=2593676 RepID=UPI000F204889|nr:MULTISPECIES: hypothetical protein [unclassified Streptomyces]RKT17084.1 hypothetical protein BX285_1448 [Streptomyces sp. 1114.5]